MTSTACPQNQHWQQLHHDQQQPQSPYATYEQAHTGNSAVDSMDVKHFICPPAATEARMEETITHVERPVSPWMQNYIYIGDDDEAMEKPGGPDSKTEDGNHNFDNSRDGSDVYVVVNPPLDRQGIKTEQETAQAGFSDGRHAGHMAASPAAMPSGPVHSMGGGYIDQDSIHHLQQHQQQHMLGNRVHGYAVGSTAGCDGCASQPTENSVYPAAASAANGVHGLEVGPVSAAAGPNGLSTYLGTEAIDGGGGSHRHAFGPVPEAGNGNGPMLCASSAGWHCSQAKGVMTPFEQDCILDSRHHHEQKHQQQQMHMHMHMEHVLASHHQRPQLEMPSTATYPPPLPPARTMYTMHPPPGLAQPLWSPRSEQYLVSTSSPAITSMAPMMSTHGNGGNSNCQNHGHGHGMGMPMAVDTVMPDQVLLVQTPTSSASSSPLPPLSQLLLQTPRSDADDANSNSGSAVGLAPAMSAAATTDKRHKLPSQRVDKGTAGGTARPEPKTAGSRRPRGRGNGRAANERKKLEQQQDEACKMAQPNDNSDAKPAAKTITATRSARRKEANAASAAVHSQADSGTLRTCPGGLACPMPFLPRGHTVTEHPNHTCTKTAPDLSMRIYARRAAVRKGHGNGDRAKSEESDDDNVSLSSDSNSDSDSGSDSSEIDGFSSLEESSTDEDDDDEENDEDDDDDSNDGDDGDDSDKDKKMTGKKIKTDSETDHSSGYNNNNNKVKHEDQQAMRGLFCNQSLPLQGCEPGHLHGYLQDAYRPLDMDFHHVHPQLHQPQFSVQCGRCQPDAMDGGFGSSVTVAASPGPGSTAFGHAACDFTGLNGNGANAPSAHNGRNGHHNPNHRKGRARRPAGMALGSVTTSAAAAHAATRRMQRDLEDRIRKDRFLVEQKRAGLTYKEIRLLGGFKEAESTLRGRHRALTKPKEERVRRPVWQPRDDRLLCRALRELSKTNGNGKQKISWKVVADYIYDNGGSYHFGNTTCRKRWDHLQNMSQ